MVHFVIIIVLGKACKSCYSKRVAIVADAVMMWVTDEPRRRQSAITDSLL